MIKLMKCLAVLFMVPVILVIGYIIYLEQNYYRIADNMDLLPVNKTTSIPDDNKVYSIVTYNIGFGAYDHDFSFFMDEGVMQDGIKVQGKSAIAASKIIVQHNTIGAIKQLTALNPDFMLLQEVDVKSTRSYEINQKQLFVDNFSRYSYSFANNFHSAFLPYPFTQPHGSVNSGLLSIARYNIASAVFRSYPINESFVAKFFDLDRCFSLNRIQVKNGKQLVLINSHLSAYDKGGAIRSKQLEVLKQTLKTEYDKGNYIVVGGDFNCALFGTIDSFASKQNVPEWISAMPEDFLPEGFSFVKPDNVDSVPTCRSADIPYDKEASYKTVIDGFIVSDNIIATAHNLDVNFKYSDHNPVRMSFRLK